MPKNHVAPANRKDVLLRLQQAKMAGSAHAYVRGNTIKFYEWLRSDAVRGSLPVGPEIWICGDCHIGNLGPVADIGGKIAIQIRDLDQTVIGNPAHDLLRLGLSLAMAARSSDLPGVTTALMLEEMIIGYLSGLNGRTIGEESVEVQSIQKVVRDAAKRTWTHLAEERIEDATPQIPKGRRFWPMTEAEQKEMETMFDQGGAEKLAHCINGEGAREKVRLLDSAYWVKGCSSLGRLRYAVLVSAGKRKARDFRLLDIKEATKAAAPCAESRRMPATDAERVVAGARNLSPYLGQRMMAETFAGRQVVVRELRPQDLKFELTGLTQMEAVTTARLMAVVVGKAHGRQMKTDDRRTWVKELKKRHSAGLDAPRWLWSGVVDLIALHEAAYLEHCRRFASS